MKKILRFAKKKRKFSPNASDTASVASAGYELREKDLGKLHKAASTGDLTKLRQLIKKNDVNQLDKENRAPLHLACASGHVEAVTFLVEHKSKLNICDNDNRSPLMKAVQCQQERCAIILLDHNADPNLVDINGNTALHLAALIPNISLVMHLIEREAHMNARNKDGNTPLLLAAIENHQEIVELLLKEGADVNAKDKTGRTALMIAASNGQISLVKLLLHYNADVSLKEDKGWTAEDHAMMNGHHACSHLISEHDTRKKLLQSPYYGPNKVKGNHAAEAGFALGGPATDKDEFQESPEQKWRTSDSEKVTDDASQTESVSRASKGAGDSWLSSNEDEELQFNSKVPQKLSLAKLLNTSQQSKDNVEKTNFCKVRNTDNLHPVESDIESEEESEEDSRDEEEINDNCSPLQPSPQSKTPLLASPQTAMPSSSSFIKTQSNSTPFKGCKQDRSSEEETLPVEICSPNSRVAANQPANLDETSTYSAQAEDTSQQKNRRDLMFELGLEEVEPEENIESPWDSESTTESPQKKSIGSVASSVKEQPKMQHTPANQNNEMLESNTVVQPPLTFEGNKQKSDLVAELGLIDAGDIEESDLKISLLEDEDNEKENFDWKVEEEKNKHFQNQERNNYDKLGNSELEEENKNNWSIKQNVPHEKSIQHQNNERLDLKLAQEYGDSLRQLKTNVTSKLDKEKQKENFINKDRTRKPVFKGPSKSSASKKFTRPVNISDDLDDLTQSSDTGTDGSESPSSAYKNTPLLIAQLDTEAIDSISLLKIQNLVHEYERAVEREKKRYALLSEKVKYLENERKELHQALDKTKEMKSKLECQKMESDTDFNNVKFSLKQEEEKRKIAEILYEKSREQLQKKELQYCEELKAKQELELIIRNMELERKSLISNIEQLHEDHNELQQQFNREQSIHREIVNSHLHRNHGIEEEDKKALKNAEVATHLCDVNDNEKDVMLQNHSLQNEIAVLKLELVRVRERNQEEQGKYMEQIEALKEKLDDTKKDLKFNEEALTHTALQYNSQLNSLKTEISMLTSKLEHEKQNKEKLETETEAIRSQLSIALKELERSQAAKCESEQVLQREHDEWHHSDEKRNYEISSLRESNNSLSQKLSKEEAKANKLDSELHRATLSLAEKNLMLESVQRSLNQSQARINDLEHTNQLQKEQISKFTVRQESMQERLAQAQSEIMLLRQQLEDAQNKGIMKEKAVTDVQDRFNDIFSKLRRDGERQICLVEERNKELVSKTIEQREQICKFENEKIERETTLRQLQQELADALKKLSMSEASLEVTTRYRNETEEEKIRMQNQLEKLKMELQGMRDGCMQSERKIHHLQNTLDDKERDLITVSQKMQDALSTSSRTKEAAKQFEEHIQRLEIENAKLESMAKQQANKSEVMEKELQDTVSVRTRLEDLITSLQGVKVNLEDQLGQEVQKQTMLSQSVKDSHQLWEEELKTRSKLGLRISQLDREKDDLAGQVESERKKVKKLIELKRSVETRLAQEMKRNNELQKELNRIRTLLKTTKKKLKDYENGQTVSQLAGIQELNHGHSESETTLNRLKTKVEELSQQLETEAAKGRHLESTNQELSAQVASMKILQKNQDRLEKRKHQLEEEVVSLKHQIETNLINYSHIEQYKRDIEEHARKEIKQKLEEVNLFLQTQQASQEALEQLRATNESTIRSQLDQRIKDLELELNKLRTSQQDSINLKDSAQLELERYKELYSEELKLRKSLAAKLDRANERLAETNTKLLNERQRSKSLIANSIMNGSFNVTPALEMSQLQSTMGNVGNLGTFNRNLGNSFLNPVEDGMSSTNKVESYLAKMQEALQKNISKELVQATADLEKESTRVSPLGSAAGSLKSINQDQDPVTRATEQYLEVLKKNYML
ncbi:ankyrin repeat domain-containing protein 26 isoform X11 [Chiloscyllium punctatum]|uniref:ankyrin repeat domain-containing protein 26 isoform X11 n=1 Tax=Chiloscyllium punctatum TaxID=137246 RepID=UPI003B635EDF